MSLLERYTRAVGSRPSFSEAYLSFRTLDAFPFRLLILPPRYQHLGVSDPFVGRPFLRQPRALPLGMCHSSFNSSSRSEESISGSLEEPSTSGSPASGPSPLSRSPSDRRSEGRVPVTGREEEMGQHYYEFPDIHVSEGETSIPMTPEPDFTSRGLFSALLVSDLERFRTKYSLPNEFSLAVSPGEAHSFEPEFITIYEDALMAGLRLPLHPLARDFLIYLDIAPGQLAPNGWRHLMGAIHLWPQRFGYELTLRELLWTFRPISLHNEVGFFSLQSRQGKKIITGCPSNNKGWKHRFFQVSALGFCEENPFGHSLPEHWSGELRGK